MRRAFATLIGAAALLCAASAAAASTMPSGATGASAPMGASGSTGASGEGARGPVRLGPTTGPSISVASDPVGLSVEYQVLAADFGSAPCPPAAMVSALEALGDPTIRIGGDSQDETAPAGTPAFPGVTDLPAGFWSQLGCLESETHEPIVVGLNLASQMPAWAATIAAQARSVVPANLLSFELANEADIDGPSVPWWNATALTKTLMPFSTYLDDAEASAAQIGPGSDIEGPDFTTPRWTAEIPELATVLGLHAIDVHFYPLNACTGRDEVSIRALLTPGASGIDGVVRETIAEAQLVHLPMIISESNSVACRGLAGVSDAPAAAVWGLRLIMNALRSGITSVRFHSSASSYDPFIVAGATVTTRPLYLALVAAVNLLPLGAELQTLQTPSVLMGIHIDDPDGAQTYLVTNYAARPIRLVVPARGSVALLSVLPLEPVTVSASARASHGELSVSVAPKSVLAVTIPATATAPAA